MTLEKAIKIIKGLPRKFDIEVLLRKLIFVEKTDQGLKILGEGLTVPNERIKELIKNWRS